MAEVIEDETSYLQFGADNLERTFYSFAFPAPLPSSWINYPDKYKFAGIEINFTLDRKQWTIRTYSLLDWLAGLGGLYIALLYVCRVFLVPATTYALNQTLLTSFFRFKGDSSVFGGKDENEGEEDPKLNQSFRATVKRDKRGKAGRMEERAINLRALAEENLPETMRRDFNYSAKISKRNCLLIFCSKHCSSKSKRYAQLLKRSETRMDAEMDLQKFLYR